MSTTARAGALILCALLTACAQAAQQPIAVHMQASNDEPEHTEVVDPAGTVEYYPNRQAPTRIVFHRKDGGTIVLSCLDGAACRQMLVTARKSPTMPDGTFQVLRSDDPHIAMVKDASGEQTIGYLASNDGGGGFALFPDLKDAQSYEHQGDAARTAGKVVVGALIVGAIAALVVGAAAAAASADSN